MAPGQKVSYLRIPSGFVLLVIFGLLVTHPYRSRQGESLFKNAAHSWKEYLAMYISGVAAFFAICFLWENILALVNPHPRRLSLSNDYLNAKPVRVDKLVAFEYDTPATLYERIKFYLFLFSGISILRMVSLVMCILLSMALFCVGGAAGRKKHPWWFLFWSNIAVFFSHLGLASVGICHVRHYGKIAERSECKVLVANHSCVIEVVLMFMTNGFPSFVSRRENTKVPLFSTVCDVANAILVDRDAVTSRKQTLDAIITRATNPRAPQLMIFPEGTTGNQRTLFRFKKGAFEPGQPVQMFAFSFPYKHFNPCWTGRAVGGNNFSDVILRLCSQVVTHAEMRALPVYYPTAEEKADPILYADRCQAMMAAVLRESVSDATFKDYEAAEKNFEESLAKPKSR